MKTIFAKLAVATALLFAAIASPASAASAIIEQAKAQCIVGEQADGYLGYADASKASEELKREVRAVNQQRKAYYSKIAQRNGVTIEVTAALTAEKLIAQAPAGQCVRDSTGQWKRK